MSCWCCDDEDDDGDADFEGNGNNDEDGNDDDDGDDEDDNNEEEDDKNDEMIVIVMDSNLNSVVMRSRTVLLRLIHLGALRRKRLRSLGRENWLVSFHFPSAPQSTPSRAHLGNSFSSLGRLLISGLHLLAGKLIRTALYDQQTTVWFDRR